MINTHLKLPLSRTKFHGSKGVPAVEVLLYLKMILDKFILFLHKTICCDHSLELSGHDSSNEGSINIGFNRELRKNISELSSNTPLAWASNESMNRY